MAGQGMMYGAYGGMGWMLIGMIFWVILVVGIVLLLVWVVRRGKEREGHAEEMPLDILKKRYARGEITQEEYEKMKRDLS